MVSMPPEADIDASVGSAIYLRDLGSCLTDNFGGKTDLAQTAVQPRIRDTQSRPVRGT